mgnify:CR=1 FL=1
MVGADGGAHDTVRTSGADGGVDGVGDELPRPVEREGERVRVRRPLLLRDARRPLLGDRVRLVLDRELGEAHLVPGDHAHAAAERLADELDEIYLNGHPTERLAGNLNLSFAYIEGESMLMGLNGSAHPDQPAVAVSSGSACTSATLEHSYVLKALGVGDELAHTSIRFGLGRFNTDEEIDQVADLVISEVKRLRELSPLYEMAKEGIDLKDYFAGASH